MKTKKVTVKQLVTYQVGYASGNVWQCVAYGNTLKVARDKLAKLVEKQLKGSPYSLHGRYLENKLVGEL